MLRIIKGLGLAAGAGLVIVGGFTGAFFSDTETSTGNIFTAGAIDLLVDNESYYNGNVCAVDTEDIDEDLNFTEYVWQGDALFPVPGTPCVSSFGPSNLDGLFFFSFTDLKPDDEGEDTISIHVQNDAWICMDLTLTSNDDRSSTEPELEDGDAEETPDMNDGELAQNINFLWWADDGDNVYEVGEPLITPQPISLANLDTLFPIALADPLNNVWGNIGEPVPAGTSYIAKAWCLGTLTPDPVPAGQGENPSVDPGVDCDGTLLNNETQTDSAELNIIFTAEQARNNPNFRCNPPDERTATLTVNKALLTSTAGIEVADFQLTIDGPGAPIIVTDEVPQVNLPAGDYLVSEAIVGDVGGNTFVVTFSGACTDVDNDDIGEVTLGPGDDLVCNILNDQVGDGIGD